MKHSLVRLGDICTVVSGSTPKSGISDYWDGDVVWITPAELTEDSYIINDSVRHITQKAVQETSLKPFPAGTVILSSRAPIGKTAIAGREMYCNQGFKNLICSSRVNNKYLYFFLSCKTEYLNSLGRGATFKEISKTIVENIEIPLPGIPKQKRIATEFEHIQGLEQGFQKQVSFFDQLVKSQFVEMFGTYPANPMGWDTGTIRDIVADVRYGSSRPAVDGGKYPYLRMNNITYGGELDLTDTKRIDVPENELDKCTVRRGDVLFNRTNSKELVGKTCVYNRDEMMVLAGFVIRVRVTKRILPEFLSAFLNTDFSKQMLLGMCKAAIGQANINAQEMQNIGLYLPPVALQQQFIQFKSQVDKSKFSCRRAGKVANFALKCIMEDVYGVMDG